MLAYKIAQSLLLPSVSIFGLLCAAAFFYWRQKKKIAKYMFIMGLFLYYALSITPIADLFLRPLELQHWYATSEEIKTAQNIVLLMGGKQESRLRAGETLRLYNQNQSIAKIIISGRDPLQAGLKKANQIKKYLTQRGIPSEKIILEKKSKTTFENAQEVRRLVGAQPFLLVTSAFHMPRALWSFRYFKTYPIPAPCNFKSKNQYNALDFLPSAYNLHHIDLALHEYFGLVFYRLYYR